MNGRPPRGGPSNPFAALFVQAPAGAFRFLRQPSRPNRFGGRSARQSKILSRNRKFPQRGLWQL
jgi:hypothetical protein